MIHQNEKHMNILKNVDVDAARRDGEEWTRLVCKGLGEFEMVRLTRHNQTTKVSCSCCRYQVKRSCYETKRYGIICLGIFARDDERRFHGQKLSDMKDIRDGMIKLSVDNYTTEVDMESLPEDPNFLGVAPLLHPYLVARENNNNAPANHTTIGTNPVSEEWKCNRQQLTNSIGASTDIMAHQIHEMRNREYHQQRNVCVQRYNNAMMEMIFRVQTIGGIECMNVIEITTCLRNGTIMECTGVGKGSA